MMTLSRRSRECAVCCQELTLTSLGSSAPQVQQQGAFAPPPGPPPAQTQGGRPTLPARQSVAATKAQPDDLDDVKKVSILLLDAGQRSSIVIAVQHGL